MENSETVTLYQAIGAEETVRKLVHRFYELMDTLPEAQVIRAMHADDLGLIRDVLKRYLTEWTGGPKLYSPEKGHPRLRCGVGGSGRDFRGLRPRGGTAQPGARLLFRPSLQ